MSQKSSASRFPVTYRGATGLDRAAEAAHPAAGGEAMAEIVNLRAVRKARERAAKAAKASENRVAFGRTKAERDEEKAKAGLAERRHESHRLDGEEP
jgi:hypothetical protein